MRHANAALVSLALAAAALTVAAQAPQGNRGARDLFLGYNPPAANTSSGSMAPSGGGMAGTKVSIELNRGGDIRFVPPTTAFRSGDRIRLHFALNFSGYVEVWNRGSSGRVTRLFPHGGASNRVERTSDYRIPNDGWIVFDDNPGREELTLFVSQKPMAGGGGGGYGGGGMSSSGGSASSAEQQEILAILNSRSSNARDLRLEVDGDSGYAFNSSSGSSGGAGEMKITFLLEHR